MKNPDPNADRGTAAEAEAEDPQAQQIDLDDVEISAEPVASKLPPGLPPLPPQSHVPQPPAHASASQPPPAPSASFAPLPPPPSMAPPAPSRGPMFYVGILVGVLVVSAAVGTIVALSRRRAPVATSAPTASAAPKVITIGTIEMDDNPDSGP